ncbi:reverse transcriptase domain-containing protein [Tanacetum coccineum]
MELLARLPGNAKWLMLIMRPHIDLSLQVSLTISTEYLTLGASVNVMPRNIFKYLRLANLRNTNILIEMADMMKKVPLGIIENILVRIDKFLFPSDFIIIDKTPNETISLGRPFLATIHAEINIFDKEISFRIDNDRVSYDMEKKDHNFTTPTEKFFMIKSDLDNRPQSPACNNNQSRNLRDRSPDDSLHDQGSKKKKIKLDQHTPRAHFCKPIKHTVNEKTKMWPTCDPTKSMCDGGNKIYGVSGVGNLRFWYCNYDNERKNITGIGLSFPDYLLAKYEKYQTDSLVWDDRYVEWCNVSPTPGTSSQESNNPRPRDYTFREWTLIKVGHTDISEPVKKALLKKKGHMLDKIWEYCKDVHRDSTYWWHDHGFEEEECDEMGIEIEKYDPPDVQVKTFKVKKYSFKSGQSFVCVTKEVDDALPLGRKNGSRFKEIIRNEFDAHDETIQQLGGNFQDQLGRLWFRWISFDYRVTLGFGSIAGGLDNINLVIRIPLTCGLTVVYLVRSYTHIPCGGRYFPFIACGEASFRHFDINHSTAVPRGDQGLYCSKNSTRSPREITLILLLYLIVHKPHLISFDYRVTLGFGSIVGGLDNANPVIRLPIEHGINRVLQAHEISFPIWDLQQCTILGMPYKCLYHYYYVVPKGKMLLPLVSLFFSRCCRGVILGIVYHDLYLSGKALVERENMGLDLTKSGLCPSFVEDQLAKGVGLRVVDSHSGNHHEDGFTPLETI